MSLHLAFRNSPVLFGLILTIVAAGLARAERPASDQLLPASTLAYLRTADIRELVARLRETAIGRIAREQQFRPLLDRVYGFANEAYESADQPVGLSLPEILSLPQGELTLAVVEPEEGRPAVVAIVDAGGQEVNLQKLIDGVETLLQDRNVKRSTEVVEGTTLTVLQPAAGSQPPLVHFQKASTLVAATDLEVARGLLARWRGKETQAPLRENEAYSTLMTRTRGAAEDTPQIRWFVDPIRFVKAAGRGNVGAQAGLALLPVLGLDGVRGAGGSLTFATEQYDSLFSLHLLLDQPRNGVLAMLALGNGDMTPESWVPQDVATYRTLYWDVERTYQELRTIYDSFRGEGALEKNIQRDISDNLGVDFQQDVLSAADQRFTHITWFEPPARIGSQAHLVGVRLKDPDRSRKTLATIAAKIGPAMKQETYAGIDYYQYSPPPEDNGAETPSDPDPRRPRRRGQPCVAIVGQYLLATDRPTFLQRAINTSKDANQSLANELDFKLIVSRLRRQGQGNPPSLLAFERPEEAMRTLYEIATGEESRRRLADAAENNPFLATIHQSLEENPLPPFSVIKRYLAPGGGILTNDQSGIHYSAFSLRRK
jgi:hypothetical protein